MKVRNVVATGALAAVMIIPAAPAHAASLEGSATETDPTGDVSNSAYDITQLTMEWDLDNAYIQVDTAGAQTPLSDPVWGEGDTEGRGLVITLRRNGADGIEEPFVLVNGDGAAVYGQEVVVSGESANVERYKMCDAEPTMTGSSLTVEFDPECIGFPGTIAASAAYNDNIAGETDNAIADDAAEESVTEISGSVEGGYWMTATDGGVFSFGDAGFYGSMGGKALNRPMVGIAGSPTGEGYNTVASDGGIFSFGDARFIGSMGGKPLNSPMVGMASYPDPDGSGYWTVAADGGVFAFGDSKFFGSMGGKKLNSPVVSMQPTASGNGYWLFAADGGVFAFGDAQFRGSAGSLKLAEPVSGAAVTPSGNGYRLVAKDGGVFAYGDADFYGSVASTDAADYPVNGIANMRDGYLIVDHEGRVNRFGDTYQFGDLPHLGVTPARDVVGMAVKAPAVT